VKITATHSFGVGDQVVIEQVDGGAANPSLEGLFTVTAITSTTDFTVNSLWSAVTNATIDGTVTYIHKIINNNVNSEAFMRSGNLAVRYQTINESVIGTLDEDLDDSETSIDLTDASRFPNSGAVLIRNEVVTYTGKTNNTLTGCTRGASFQQFVGGTNKTFTGGSASSHNRGNGFTSVLLISCTAAPQLNHWGSSYIMDGGFDTDRGYFFNYAALANSVSASASETAFFIRLAPSVSNSIAGQFGDRDLINRSQLLLQRLQLQSDKPIQVYGILNPGNIDASTLTWASVNTVALGSQPSFAQISTSNSTTAEPGEQIFSTLGPPAGFAEIDLSNLKELSNSAIGGYSNFPDGPDVLTVVAKLIEDPSTVTTTNPFTVTSRISWAESQA
jgi:hypothetical protein